LGIFQGKNMIDETVLPLAFFRFPTVLDDTQSFTFKVTEMSQPALSLNSTLPLHSGASIPLYGLGTWLAKSGGEASTSVSHALSCGYKLIDTATMYENERECGEAISASGIPRSSLFVVTKLHSSSHGREATLSAARASHASLGGTHPIDLWLMHTPNGGRVVETWRAMLEAKALGLVKAVGVSNFGKAQLQALAAEDVEEPEVNQIELHLWLQQRDTAAYCRERGIVVVAFCPLARCKGFGVEGSVLKTLAAELGRSEADLALRWLLQRGYVTIPKSTNPERIASNAHVFDFELSPHHMALLDSLDSGMRVSQASLAMDKPWAEVA
jgi:diketogulonate reductase-like aldo/keto reductase